MNDTQQLIKKRSQGVGYMNIYPKTYIELVSDRLTNQLLSDILARFNFLYLVYDEDASNTRLQVEAQYRRKGLWIAYVRTDGTLITEYSISDNIDDETWSSDTNWQSSTTAQIDIKSLEPEDLTLELEKITFANRAYDPSTYSGKGYTILRKNIQTVPSAGTVNLLTQDMINDPNTVYEIRYDFNLNGATINIPEGCTLNFIGGSINNGSIRIKGKDTVLQNGKCTANILIGLDDSEMDAAYPTWFSTKFNIVLRNMEFLIEKTKDLGTGAQAYMNTLDDSVLADDTNSPVVLQNVIGVSIENCIFTNPIVGIKFKSNTNSKRQSVARVNISNCRIKDCYCAYYANGVTTSTDFGDTSFIGNELFATKYGIYANRQDGLVLSGNTIYVTRVLDSTCLRASNIYNLNINGNQLFGGLVGVHLLGGGLSNVVSIVGNGIENQGLNRWDTYENNISILLEGLSLNDRCTISGNVIDSVGVRKYISVKNSTIQTLSFTGNSLNLRNFGFLATPSEYNFGASALNVCDPFEVINSTINTCTAERYYYTNQVGNDSSIARYNFYSLDRNDTYGKEDTVGYGVTGHIPVVKYNPIYTFVIDIYSNKSRTFNTSKTWRYAVDKTIIEIPVVANVTTMLDIYTSLFNQAVALDGVKGYNDLADNGCIYLTCENGIRVLDDDYRIPMQVITGGFDIDYSETQNFYCNSVEYARRAEANFLLGRFSIKLGSNQDRILTIASALTAEGKKISYLKDTFLFVGYSTEYTLESLTAKLNAIVDAGIYSDKLVIGTSDNSLTIKSSACNGFNITTNNLFTTTSKQYANSGALNRYFVYDSLAYAPSAYPSVDRGRYVLDADMHKPVWSDTTRWIESDGAKAGVTRRGTTSNRPDIADIYVGFWYYDTSLNKPIMMGISGWLDSEGNPADALKTGTTEQRPTGVQIGFIYKDTTLDQLVVWDGIEWKPFYSGVPQSDSEFIVNV